MKRKLVRYFFVGGAAATADFAVFFFAVKALGYPWFPVAIFSFVAATALNYLLSIRFVFESGARFGRRREVALVFLASTAGMSMNQSILWLTIDLLAMNLLVAKIVATSAVFLFNFALRHYFIFPARRELRCHAGAWERSNHWPARNNRTAKL